MTITPVTPVDREKLVPTTTSILIDFTGTPTLVDVNGLVVFDGSFQGGWSGSLLNKSGGGKRLILDSPAPFTIGDLVSVDVTENSVERLLYIFETGTNRITTSDDAKSPRVVETGSAKALAPTPLWHHTFNGGGSPQLDEEMGFDFEVIGTGVVFQQPGIIDEAIELGGAAYLRTSSADVLVVAYHQEISVISGSVAAGFQVQVTLDTAALIAAGKMRSNSRVKFLDAGDNELEYWFQGPENNVASIYWVKVDVALGTNVIRAEYSGNFDYAGSEADGNDVFEFYDDFETGTIDLSKWTVAGVGWGESGGNLTGGNNTSSNVIKSIQTFNNPVVVTTKSLETQAAPNGFSTIGFFKTTNNDLTILSHNTTSYYHSNGGFVNFGFNSLNAETVDEVWMTGTQGRVRRIKAGQTYDSGFFANVLDGEQLFIGPRGDLGSYNQTYINSWRYVHVRQYNSAISSASLGTETQLTLPIFVPPLPDPLKAQTFSIDGWFKVAGLGTERVLAACGRDAVSGWEIRLTAGNVLQVTVWDGVSQSHSEISSTVFTVPGNWVHVGMAADAADEMLRLVINGAQEVETNSWTGGFTAIGYVEGPDMEMGRDPVTDSDYFPGLIDNWRYQQDVLSVVQFRTRFQQGVEPVRYPYVGYVKEPGKLFLRQSEPLTPEIPIVDGEIVDIGYDPTLDKFIVFFVNNGAVFVTSADPGDGPTTLSQPSTLVSNISAGGSTGKGHTQSFTSADFPPLKVSVPLDTIFGGGHTGKGHTQASLGDPRAVTPVIISLDPRIIRMSRPGGQSSKRDAVGFIPLKFTKEAMRRLPFVPLPPGVDIVDFQDPATNLDARYACLVVYERGPDGKGLYVGPRGGGAGLATAADIQKSHGASVGRSQTYSFANFPPLKLALPLDTIVAGGQNYGGKSFSFTSTGFPPIGVG
jgi:hypothetical protein